MVKDVGIGTRYPCGADQAGPVLKPGCSWKLIQHASLQQDFDSATPESVSGRTAVQMEEPL